MHDTLKKDTTVQVLAELGRIKEDTAIRDTRHISYKERLNSQAFSFQKGGNIGEL